MCYEYQTMTEWQGGKTEDLGEKRDSVPVCPHKSQIYSVALQVKNQRNSLFL